MRRRSWNPLIVMFGLSVIALSGMSCAEGNSLSTPLAQAPQAGSPGTSAIQQPVQTCNNGVIEGTEICDGMTVIESCISLGWAGGGQLTCNESCTDYNTTMCVVTADTDATIDESTYGSE